MPASYPSTLAILQALARKAGCCIPAMKRVQALLLAVALLTACGASAQGAGNATRPGSEAPTVLTIAGESMSTSMNPAFAAEHPAVKVRYLWQEEYTANQLLLDLTTGKATADIYVLSISSGLLDALRQKGFCLDLSASGTLTDFAKTLYTPIQSQVLDGAKCIGIPYTLFSNQSFGFNMQVGAALHIDPPRTYAELVRLCAAWPEICETVNASGQYRLTTGAFTGTVGSLLRYGMDAYIATQADPLHITFDTPIFRGFIDTLAQARTALAVAPADYTNGQPGDALIVDPYPILPTQDDSAIDLGTVKPLILSMAEGADACIPTEMTVLIVNALSAHKDTAVAYLECLATHYPAYQQVLLCDGAKQPVEDENYQENRAYYESMQETLTARLALADAPEARQSLRAQLADAATCMQEVESLRWYITQAALDQYAAIAPMLRLMPKVSYAYYFSLPNARRLLLDFIDGTLSGDALVTQFDQIQKIIALE